MNVQTPDLLDDDRQGGERKAQHAKRDVGTVAGAQQRRRRRRAAERGGRREAGDRDAGGD
jgi:hypothetical protein